MATVVELSNWPPVTQVSHRNKLCDFRYLTESPDAGKPLLKLLSIQGQNPNWTAHLCCQGLSPLAELGNNRFHLTPSGFFRARFHPMRAKPWRCHSLREVSRGRLSSLEMMRYTSFNKGWNVKLQKEKIHFVSVGHWHHVIIECNDSKIRFPSLENYWKTTEYRGTF